MVSSSLNMSAEEVLEVLFRLQREEAEDPEYQALRSHLPAEWPI